MDLGKAAHQSDDFQMNSVQNLRNRLQQLKQVRERQRKLDDSTQELTGPTVTVTDPATWMQRMETEDNSPENWLSFTNYMRDSIKYASEAMRFSNVSNYYARAIKVLPSSEYKQSEAYAQLLINCANFKGGVNVEDARSLFSYARSTVKSFAVVHVEAAQLEVSHGNSAKAKKILDKARQIGAEPADVLAKAFSNLAAGNRLLFEESDSQCYAQVSENKENVAMRTWDGSQVAEVLLPAAPRPGRSDLPAGSKDKVSPALGRPPGERQIYVDILKPNALAEREQRSVSESSEDYTTGEMYGLFLKPPLPPNKKAMPFATPVKPLAPGEATPSIALTSSIRVDGTVSFNVPDSNITRRNRKCSVDGALVDNKSNASGNTSDEADTIALAPGCGQTSVPRMRTYHSTPDCKNASILSSGKKSSKFLGRPMRVPLSSKQMLATEDAGSDEGDDPRDSRLRPVNEVRSEVMADELPSSAPTHTRTDAENNETEVWMDTGNLDCARARIDSEDNPYLPELQPENLVPDGQSEAVNILESSNISIRTRNRKSADDADTIPLEANVYLGGKSFHDATQSAEDSHQGAVSVLRACQSTPDCQNTSLLSSSKKRYLGRPMRVLKGTSLPQLTEGGANTYDTESFRLHPLSEIADGYTAGTEDLGSAAPSVLRDGCTGDDLADKMETGSQENNTMDCASIDGDSGLITQPLTGAAVHGAGSDRPPPPLSCRKNTSITATSSQHEPDRHHATQPSSASSLHHPSQDYSPVLSSSSSSSSMSLQATNQLTSSSSSQHLASRDQPPCPAAATGHPLPPTNSVSMSRASTQQGTTSVLQQNMVPQLNAAPLESPVAQQYTDVPQDTGASQQAVVSQPTGAPQHQPGAPQHQPGAPQHQPGAPQHQPGAPQHQPGAPQHQLGAAQHQPGASRHQPGAPQHQPGASQHQSGAPQHQPGAMMVPGGQAMFQPPMGQMGNFGQQMGKQNEILCINGKEYMSLRMIGRGGSSKVYMVLAPDSNIRAVKCVNLECTDEATFNSYKNEIKLLKRLQHSDKIIKMFDFEYKEECKMLYVVMENGDTDLASFFRTRSKMGGMGHAMRKCYWQEMLLAVQVLHKEGIVHSDLKPANFLLVAGNIKLIDFGIANAITQDMTSVTRDQQVGTLNYMSPEAIMDTCGGAQVGPDGRVKPRIKIGVKSDVWSLGCILYNMVYGRTPFHHVSNNLMKLQAITNPGCAIAFPATEDDMERDVLQKCLIRDTKTRPSIEDLLEHPYLTVSSMSAR